MVLAVQGWPIVREYRECETGGTAARAELQAMLRDAAQRRLDGVVFWALVRLMREGTLEMPALSAGVPVKVVSEMLGHSSVALTLDVYSHVLPHVQEDAPRKMAALIKDGGDEEGAKRHTIGTQSPNSSKRNIT